MNGSKDEHEYKNECKNIRMNFYPFSSCLYLNILCHDTFADGTETLCMSPSLSRKIFHPSSTVICLPHPLDLSSDFFSSWKSFTFIYE